VARGFARAVSLSPAWSGKHSRRARRSTEFSGGSSGEGKREREREREGGRREGRVYGERVAGAALHSEPCSSEDKVAAPCCEDFGGGRVSVGRFSIAVVSRLAK